MAQLIVRDIENAVKSRLQKRARRHGQSMEAEIRDILRDVVSREESSQGLGSQIAGFFTKVGIDSDIPELRGHEIKIPSFEE